MKTILLALAAFCITNATYSQLYIFPGATLRLEDNARLKLHNVNLVNNGTISATSNGRVVFNGSASNEILGMQIPNFAELEIAKTGSGLLTLQTDINVSAKIIFTSNMIELNNQNIDLGTTGMLEGENESSRITGADGGEIIFTTLLNAPTAINPANLGVIITSSKNLGNTTIKRGHQSQVKNNCSSILRYYDIVPANNSDLNATLRIKYFEAEKNGLDEIKFELFKSDDNINWVNMGHRTRNASLNFTEQIALNDFSRWTLSVPDKIPSVTGLKLKGIWKDNAAYLNWVTATENNNRQFNIERKYNDELHFILIGRKYSAHGDGRSTLPSYYSWLDAAYPGRGPIQYRLKQQDREGNFTYSNIIVLKPEVFVEIRHPLLSVSNQLYIKAGNIIDLKKMQVSIYDMKGSLLFKKQLNYQSQWLQLPHISIGTYNMFIQSGEYYWSGSFVKEK